VTKPLIEKIEEFGFGRNINREISYEKDRWYDEKDGVRVPNKRQGKPLYYEFALCDSQYSHVNMDDSVTFHKIYMGWNNEGMLKDRFMQYTKTVNNHVK